MHTSKHQRLSFEEGGLPAQARARVEEAAAQGGGFFTTTFSVAEMAIARLAGYEPIGQVMGSSFYHVGWSSYIGYAGGELEAVSHAMRDARDRAIGRMTEEASILGAHAVVGVKLHVRGYEWAGELSEFTAVGTAVRTRGATPSGPPALSNLSVQELYKLELAGMWPVGIALGNCTWYDRHADCMSDGSWTNQELPNHMACIEQARTLAVRRFRADVERVGADAAVGVTVNRHFHENHWEQNDREHTSFKVEIALLGTSIRRVERKAPPRPKLVLDLGDRKIDLNAATSGEE